MRKTFFTCFCLLVISSFTTALTLSEQRDVYTQAVNFQEQGRWVEAAQKSQLIPEYPLTYLLDYQYLKANFKRSSVDAVQSFMRNNGAYKISNDLQREYLYYLGKNEYWREYLDFYPQLPRSLDLKCFYFQAKIAQGEAGKIWPDVEKTWLSGYSLANVCDSVFSYYLQNNKISQPLIWQRFQLAYLKNQQALMSYLIGLMDDQTDITLAKQLYRLNRSPQTLLSSDLFKQRQQASYAFLLTSIKRLAIKDISLGLQAYSAYENKIPFTDLEKASLKKHFISRILINNETDKLQWLDKELTALGDSQLIEQRIRHAIKLDNWHDIEYWLAQLTPLQRQDEKWQYWQARVLENKQQPTQATSLYQKIASQRTYYGFLAAQKLQLDYQFNAQIVTETPLNLSDLDSQLAHIEELYFHQHMHLLKREWLSLLGQLNYDRQRQLGLYAFQKGWAHLSVLASIHSKSWDALNIRFPEVKSQPFSDNANKYQIESSYIYAITRQESSFDEFARSPVGARGYMQLMPNTAAETAKKIGLKEYKEKKQLTEGAINIQLGTAYFDSLLTRYKGNRILATAAYNAGPYRVDRWRGNKEGRAEQGLTMDSWVETIPYKETRNYVKNVLAYNLIYQHILDKPLLFLNPAELNARF